MISRSLIGETDEEKMKNLFLRILPYFYVKHQSYDIEPVGGINLGIVAKYFESLQLIDC